MNAWNRSRLHPISSTRFRNYARGLLRNDSSYWAVLAVPHGETTEPAENSLTFGLLWLDRAREVVRRGFVAGLRLTVPKGTSGEVAHHTLALRPQSNIEVYELDTLQESVSRVEPRSAGNLETWLVPCREAQPLLDQAKARIEPIVARSPQAITVHPAVPSREVWLRFRGLAFARWDDGNVFFGSGDLRKKLTSASEPAFLQLLDELELRRHPLASETRHSFYRQQAERVDAALDPRFATANTAFWTCWASPAPAASQFSN